MQISDGVQLRKVSLNSRPFGYNHIDLPTLVGEIYEEHVMRNRFILSLQSFQLFFHSSSIISCMRVDTVDKGHIKI